MCLCICGLGYMRSWAAAFCFVLAGKQVTAAEIVAREARRIGVHPCVRKKSLVVDLFGAKHRGM